MTENFESQVADALQQAMPITEGPAFEHRALLAEILAPRVMAAIQAAAGTTRQFVRSPFLVQAMEMAEVAALAALRGAPDGTV